MIVEEGSGCIKELLPQEKKRLKQSVPLQSPKTETHSGLLSVLHQQMEDIHCSQVKASSKHVDSSSSERSQVMMHNPHANEEDEHF